MLDGKMPNYVDIRKGVAQGCTLSPNLFKVCINDMIDGSGRSTKGGSDGGGRYGVRIDACG